MGSVPLTNEQLANALSLSSQRLSRTTLLGIWAAKEALSVAGITTTDCSQLTFVNGTTVGGMDLTESSYAEWMQGSAAATIMQHEANASTVDIANYFGGFASVATVSTACSSALNALIAGANRLRTGKYSMALVGGTEALTQFHTEGFHSLRILDDKPCRPFCQDRAGLNLGEGAAYLLLETEEHARQRGAAVLAYVAGYGNACDAFHQTASSPNGEGAYLAMRQALQMAQIQPQEVDYINAHGTATPNNDASEMEAFRRLFGEGIPPYSSTKAYTGHTTSASGAIEAVFCVQCLKQGFIPASLNSLPVEVGFPTPVQHTLFQPLRYVLSNAFGFGGNCSSVLLASSPAELPSLQVLPIHQTEMITVGCADEVKQYITPMQARRLTPTMRLTLAAAKKALEKEGINVPEAILCATRYGCIRTTRLLLEAMTSHTEISPTLFMQSTHNTVASIVAMHLHAHGFNCTYSCGADSEQVALAEARLLVGKGMVNNVLLLCFDEADEVWQTFLPDDMLPMTTRSAACVIKR